MCIRDSSCTDLNRIGEVRDGVAADRLTAGDTFVRDGYTYHLFSSNKRNDYAVIDVYKRQPRP